MKWKDIRLELARTKEFPDGSPCRAYLLRLPLEDDGLIDEASLKEAPARATVRRYWPNQADMFGHVVRTPLGWAFSYEPSDEDVEAVFHLETHAIRPGEYLTLTEPDGGKLPFRVAGMKQLD